jgi:hypothetical protein
MKKENSGDGRNGLELPKLIGDEGMGNEIQVSQIEEIIKKVQNIRDYCIPITTSEVTNAMQQNTNDFNWEVQLRKLIKEVVSCGSLMQSLSSTRQDENLQKKIDDYESRLSNYNDILVEDEVVLSSLKAKLTRLDWTILATEKHVHFALTQRQESEDANANFEIRQLPNVELKEAEDGHKNLVDEKQLRDAQVNSRLEVVAKQQNK